MNDPVLLTLFIEKLQGLPEEKQTEVFDFIDYLASRFTKQPKCAPWTEHEFSLLSVTQAMRDLEDEPDIYHAADLKERWQ